MTAKRCRVIPARRTGLADTFHKAMIGRMSRLVDLGYACGALAYLPALLFQVLFEKRVDLPVWHGKLGHDYFSATRAATSARDMTALRGPSALPVKNLRNTLMIEPGTHA